tara:strand:- start:447 stop:623 length:177 start_codon:yes stop_codon:yes gene_type:complete
MNTFGDVDFILDSIITSAPTAMPFTPEAEQPFDYYVDPTKELNFGQANPFARCFKSLT